MMGRWEDMGDFPNAMRAMSKDGFTALELGGSDGSWWWGLYVGRQGHILVGGDCKGVMDQDEAKAYAQRAAATYFKKLAEEFSP